MVTFLKKHPLTQSFFGKLKNLHSGPPAPPRRTDNNAGWPQDEFDDDEGDMYEAPPCERPAVKVPPRQVEENIYLERTSNPAVPQRQAAPPPRLGKALPDFYYDPVTKKPPEIDRNEKPGRKKMMPPPPVRPAPAPVPAPNTEEDVYLDPNEEQEDNDDLYLEPTAAPSVEARRATFPATFNIKLPPPTPGHKPPLPANLTKPSPPNPPMADTKPVVSSAVMRAAKQSGNEDKEWFAGDCNRRSAEDLLLRVNKDGAFLIRHSSAQSGRQPYTLAVLYQQKVYNIPIRFLEETRGYALGKEGKKNEEIFGTLDEMISHHKNNQLLLIDSKSQAKHTAYLTHAARP
ncbi:SH2 domain-containing protein 6 [Symphorus nematophorus]